MGRGDSHLGYADALHRAAELHLKLKNDNREPVHFMAIASVPNFEFWLLLHYENIQHLFHRDEVMRKLKKYITDYDKGATNIFALTQNNLGTATQRATALSQKTTAHTAERDSIPYTDMHVLVGVLGSLGNA